MNRRLRVCLPVTAALAVLINCRGGSGTAESAAPAPVRAAGEFHLTSPAFTPDGAIPVRHTCDGQDLSPALHWTNPPPGTAAFALVCHDPDAPAGDWVHWLIYNLPDTMRALPEGVPPDPEPGWGSLQGRNDFGRLGYGGPCPPPGKPHRYHFVLYALKSRDYIVKPAMTRDEFIAVIRDHIIAQTELVGTYGR